MFSKTVHSTRQDFSYRTTINISKDDLFKMNLTYRHTIAACCISYISQAIVVNFAPLLFLQFQNQYGVSLSQISLLIAICFGVELCADIFAAKISDRFSQRAMLIFSLVSTVLGVAGFAVFPNIFGNYPFIGLVIAEIFCGVGGGLLEVLITPIVEACTTENKASTISLLHSFYCWGQAAVILITTLFIVVFGIDNWQIMAFIWTALPIIALIMFIYVPIYNDPSKLDTEKRAEYSKNSSISELLKNRIFIIFMIVMIMAGASELSMSQWASSFAESGLGVSKAVGDICGPCLFGILMGTARILYSRFGKKLNAIVCMMSSCILCIISYLMAAFSPVPIIALLGCALCGLSVGILWPVALALASEKLSSSIALFGTLAIGGDLGCLAGPAIAGFVADTFHGNISVSFAFSTIFPLTMLISLGVLYIGEKKKASSAQ